jgi:hypothetical protein
MEGAAIRESGTASAVAATQADLRDLWDGVNTGALA